MTDIPGNSSTTATVTVGSTTDGSLEIVGDHDWFRIELTAGQTITIELNGASFNGVEDPYLRLRDSSGNLLFENDDGGDGLNSRLTFTASYTGVYYIDVGSWNDGSDGEYVLTVNPYAPPPVGTMDDVADQLASGYWGGYSYHFDVAEGGSISVNLTALTFAGQNLAREALALWTDIIGVTFVEVTTGGQITFDDNEENAFADFITSGSIITSAHINISTEWLSTYGTGLNSYSFQTYVHEIGHALGLGHAGNYNTEAQYPYDTLFQIDGWPASIMSYFDQQESSYWSEQGFTFHWVVTPMMADILAMSMLYGQSTTTRTGDTTYGFNSNSGRAIFDSNVYPGVSYTIFDSGGTDTLDFSGFTTNQLINLTAETFSNVGGGVGNVSIARSVTIENAIGGSGNDSILGNGANNVLNGLAGNDYLNGGAGADTMAGGAGSDIYYVDQPGDQVIELLGEGDDILVATASYSLGAGAHVETMAAYPGTAAVNLTGNELGQSLYGNEGDNILTGMGGADYLVGGAGNDRYYVDNLDLIAEAIGGGDDWVFVPGTYILRDGAEIETLVALNQNSLDPVNLTGNEFGQSLYGSQGNNYLNGGAGNDYLVGLGGNDSLLGGEGADWLEGGLGNDVYYGVEGIDSIIERAGEGDDLVVATSSYALASGVHVETMSAQRGTAAINLTGNGLGQSIYGNDGANILLGAYGTDYLVGNGGNDVLNAGSGNDWLRGGDGADRFAFDGIAGNDTILDFVSGTDRIDLSSYGISLDNVSASTSGNDTILTIDGNRDGTPDFTITLTGVEAPLQTDYLF